MLPLKQAYCIHLLQLQLQQALSISTTMCLSKQSSQTKKRTRKKNSNEQFYSNIRKYKDIQNFKGMTNEMFGPKLKKSDVDKMIDRYRENIECKNLDGNDKLPEYNPILDNQDKQLQPDYLQLNRDKLLTDTINEAEFGPVLNSSQNFSNRDRQSVEDDRFDPLDEETNYEFGEVIHKWQVSSENKKLHKLENELEFGSALSKRHILKCYRETDVDGDSEASSFTTEQLNIPNAEAGGEDTQGNIATTNNPITPQNVKTEPHNENSSPSHKDSADKYHSHLLQQLEPVKSYPLIGEKLPLPDSYGVIEPVNDYLSSGLKAPSVGAVLKETMSPQSKAALERWEKQKIAELGEDGFHKYKQEIFRNGSNFHECVAAKLRNEGVSILPANEGVWHSVESTFSDVTDVSLVETEVKHPHLGYMGILDCVIKYRGETVLVDWKTSDKRKATLDAAYDDPVQIMAYVGALNSDPNFDLQVKQGLLVVAYRDGRPADVLPMKPVVAWMYWNKWLTRLHSFWGQKLTAGR